MSIGSTNLAEALLWVGVFIAAVTLFTVITVWVARRRGSTTMVLDAAVAIAQIWLLLAGFGVVLVVARSFGQGEYTFTDLPMTIEGPQPFADDAAGTTGTGAELVWASVNTASAWVSGLSIGTRLILGVGDALGIILFATPALLMWIISRQTRRGVPFTRNLSRWLFGAAIIVLAAGIGAEVLGGIGTTLASLEALPPRQSGALVTSDGVFTLQVPLWPLAAALALCVLGVVFRHGTVLQRDTEGLV